MTQKETQPLVSIITINFNDPEVTCELLSSLQAISYQNIEIIVVDNGSTKGKTAIIKERFPEVSLVYNKKNLGFAGGNNVGTKLAKGKYVLYLNNDIEVSPGFIEPMVDLFESRADAGMCSPKILYYQSGIIEYAGGTFIHPITTRKTAIKNYTINGFTSSELKETQLPHGAALMVPANLVKEIGLMPDIYFLYYEEHDWAELFKRRGYKIYFNGSSEVYHKSSLTVGNQSTIKTYFMSRGRVLFLRRNTKGFKKLIALLFITFVTLPIHSFKYLYKLQFSHLRVFLKGMFWHLGKNDIYKNPQLVFDEQGNKIIKNAYYKND